MSEAGEDDNDHRLNIMVEAFRRELAINAPKDGEFSHELIKMIVRDVTKDYVPSAVIISQRREAIEAAFESIGLPIDDRNRKATAASIRRLLFWSEIGGKFFKGVGMSFLSALGAWLLKKYGPEGWN